MPDVKVHFLRGLERGAKASWRHRVKMAVLRYTTCMVEVDGMIYEWRAVRPWSYSAYRLRDYYPQIVTLELGNHPLVDPLVVFACSDYWMGWMPYNCAHFCGQVLGLQVGEWMTPDKLYRMLTHGRELDEGGLAYGVSPNDDAISDESCGDSGDEHAPVCGAIHDAPHSTGLDRPLCAGGEESRTADCRSVTL